MPESCYVIESELVVIKPDAVWKYRLTKIVSVLMRLFKYLFLILGSGFLTFEVYQRCVFPAISDNQLGISLSDSIATGALFATFGSALISVVALLATRNLELYSENLEIISQQLIPSGFHQRDWTRWPFLPRMSRLVHARKCDAIGVKNTAICFSIEPEEERFPLPTTISDFYDLPVFRSYMRMKRLKRSYLNYLDSKGWIHEYPIWICVCAIYKRILAYRLSKLCIWIGAAFIFQSIVFAFFYPYIYSCVQ